MTNRIPCCVPGCRRSFRADTCEPGHDYICARCFKLADSRFRQRYQQLRRRRRVILRLTSAKSLDRIFDQARARGRQRCVCHHDHDRQLRAAWDKCWYSILRDAEIKLALGADGAPRRRFAA
jgi:hypothetical protein